MVHALGLNALQTIYSDQKDNKDFVAKSSDDFIQLMILAESLPNKLTKSDTTRIFREFINHEQINQLNSDDITKIINSVVKKDEDRDEDTKCRFLQEFIYSKKSNQLDELGQIDISATLKDYKKIIDETDFKNKESKLSVVSACIEDIADKMKEGSSQITPDTVNEFIKGAGIKSLSSALKIMKDTDVIAEIKGPIIEQIKSDGSYLKSPAASPRAALSSQLEKSSLESEKSSSGR
jgi:hypothetical protein